MVIFNSKLLVYQRVFQFSQITSWIFMVLLFMIQSWLNRVIILDLHMVSNNIPYI